MNTTIEMDQLQEGDLLYNPRLDAMYLITGMRNYHLTPDEEVFYTLHPQGDAFSTEKPFTLSRKNIEELGLQKL